MMGYLRCATANATTDSGVWSRRSTCTTSPTRRSCRPRRRFQLGRTLGGAEGERMTQEALAWMRAAGCAPDRMIDLLLPPV